jgi:hypothetical protein
MRCLLPLLFLTACGDDGQGFEPPPAPPECRVCDIEMIGCGGYILTVGFVEVCEGDGCLCEAAPCRDAGVPIVEPGDLVCATVPRP